MPERPRSPTSPALFWHASEAGLARAVSAGSADRQGSQGAPAVVFSVALAAFALLTPTGLPNGDAAVYAQQVLAGDFASRPVHLGYYLLAALLSFSRQVPDYFFNLLSSFFAAGALALVYSLARLYLRGAGRSDAGLLAVAAPAALFGNVFFLENAVHAEIYGAAAFFLLAALLLWLRSWPLAAGLCFGVAGLVTPSAALFAPVFLLTRRPRPGALLTLGATALAVVLLPILPLLQEYLYGDRGLLAATRQGMGPLRIAAKEAFEVGVGFLAFLPLLALGLWRAGRQAALQPFLAAVAALWAATALLGERFSDVPAQLPAWTLAALFAAFGVAELAERLGESLDAPAPHATLILGLACLLAALPVAGLLALRGRAASVAPVGVPQVAIGLAAILLAFLFGWRYLRAGRGRAAAGLLVAMALVAGFLPARRMVLAKNLQIDGYRAAALALGEKAAPDFLAVGSWEKGMLLEHYLFRRSYTEHFLNTAWLEGGWGAERQARAQADLAAAIDGGRQIWLLGPAAQVEQQLAGRGYRFEEAGLALRRARRPPVAPASPPAAPLAEEP